MMDAGWILTGGTMLDDGAEHAGDVVLSGGAIAENAPAGARRFDATDLILAPGLCDVHGDGFERNLSPRPGVTFPVDVALIETDRQLIANGITTAWLALTISWEPGLRGLEMAERILEALDRLRPQLACDIRVQLRWEIFAHDAVPAIERWLTMRPRPVLAFNDHLTGVLEGDRQLRKLAETAARAGLSSDAYMDLIRSVADRADEVPVNIERLAAMAAGAGVTCFAHDEGDAETRRRNRAAGITVSEFPLSAEAAREAIDAGEATILGAPNVLRGGSHIGAVDAVAAIAQGLCSVLASDYYYPSQLQAAARLETDSVGPLAAVWPLISANAARACGLDDRGRLGSGQRGDVVALARRDGALSVEAVFRAGRPVMVRDGARLS
jgi:alpha-D-ribose 1-methylphosphonate 5-triphosphate diphosphatase